MRTYVAAACVVATTQALAAAPTTTPRAPLPFTSPKKVDEALRKNDPLLHLASRLIRDVNARRGVRSVYAWCRRADDVADEAGVDSAQALARLDEIEADLRAALQGAPRNAVDAGLAATFKSYPKLQIEPFLAMLDGMRSEQKPEVRFERFEPDLRLYCERVAGGVGLMLLPLLGAADASPDTKKRAVDLGVAIQLTNILRDVGGDAVDLNRVYLPLEDLRATGAQLDDVLVGRLTPEYVQTVELQVARARELYASARLAVPELPKSSRLVVYAIIELLEAIVDELEKRGGDSLTRKLKPSTPAVLGALVRAVRQSYGGGGGND